VEQRTTLLAAVAQAREQTALPLARILAEVGLDAATYHRWRALAAGGVPAMRTRRPTRRLVPTPAEFEAVCQWALQHPAMGYKRLTALMADRDQVCLPAYQVLEILREANLLARKPSAATTALRRPDPPERPDEVWHIDLMYVHVGGRWCYLVDIVDGYSRYLVHWTLNWTMLAETVTNTVQGALERLAKLGRTRPSGEPRIVHDSGSQFVSGEWKRYLGYVGATGIRTRVAHPESNGRVERLHRTHREEALLGGALADYGSAVAAMEGWEAYYNWKRPHSALHYLTPGIYYRGDPEATLRLRAERMLRAREKRQAYWEQQS
jgi:transposase InsO family protein